MEDSDGQILDNVYEYPNHTLGVLPDAKSKDDWINLLKSKNKSEVLASLVFIGGTHYDPEDKKHEYHKVNVEDKAQAILATELRSDIEVRDIVNKHLSSDLKWISEAASMAEKSLVNYSFETSD